MTTLWDGMEPTAAQLEFLGLNNYGCYTQLQVRRKSVHGLALHLERLQTNSQELFGASPTEDQLRELMCQAVPDQPCSLRVTLVSQDVLAVTNGLPVQPKVVVTVSPPKESSTEPISVRTVAYQRETPWIKHRATYGPIRQTRAARHEGFDDALFVNTVGDVSEGPTFNLLLRSEDAWVWPEAEVLNGVTMQLLGRAMDGAGVQQVRRRVSADDLGWLQAAFAINASSHARPVARIDERDLPASARAVVQVEELWKSVVPEPI